jgi:hypothetical protein
MKTRPLLLLVALILPAAVPCAEPPPNPAPFASSVGIVNGVNRSRMTVVIGDRLYYLSRSTRVEDRAGEPVPPDVLRRGQRVQYAFAMDDTQRRVLTRVRVRGERTAR